MLIKENVRLQSVINGTWKSALTILAVCLLSSAFNQYFLIKYLEFPSIFPSLLGTTLAFFIGFNNNQSYARWWEARIIAGGITGLSRSLARQCIGYIGQRQEAEKMIYRQIAFVYALTEYLRNKHEGSYEKYLKEEVPVTLKKAKNKYSAILQMQVLHLQELYSKGHIDGFKFAQLNETISNISGEMGKAERIKNTVYPTTYIFYTKLFIWIFIVSVTIVLNDTIGMYAVLLGMIIGYVYFISHKVGETLLNPFVPNPVGVPLDHLTRSAEIDLKEVLGEDNLPEPLSVINNEYIL
ncbi:bestrophin family ion channel [Chryseolinea sp. T2]|uniref:bestrophin family protein n=1 Tax=Chryseolinea sp. T2 TaxID=3129255 RepID=UPI003076B738